MVAGDILTFDSENKQVLLNNSEVDFTGAFPTLQMGDNTIRYTTTSSSHDYKATVKYKPRYL